MVIVARHRLSIKDRAPREKASPKPLSQAIYAIFYCLVNILRWFDPVSFHGDLRFKRSTSAGRVLTIERHHVLPHGLTANVQLIGGELWVGVADRQAAQNRQFRRDSELRANDLRIPCDQDLDGSTQASFGQGQQQRLQVHPQAEGVRWAEVTVHADNAGQRCAEKLPVAQDCGPTLSALRPRLSLFCA